MPDTGSRLTQHEPSFPASSSSPARSTSGLDAVRPLSGRSAGGEDESDGSSPSALGPWAGVSNLAYVADLVGASPSCLADGPGGTADCAWRTDALGRSGSRCSATGSFRPQSG